KDEANGINRAYLFSFRVHPQYQGKGIGSKLIKKVLNRIKEKGFTEVTIGVDQSDAKLISMYHSWGFTNYIKTKEIDHHGYDLLGKPKKVPPFDLLLKILY